MTPARRDLPGIGDLVGEFRIDAILGGRGAVIAATHVTMQQRVAIKFCTSTSRIDVERFTNAARLTSSLGSIHVSDAFSVGVLASGEWYVVMGLERGEDLARMIARGSLAITDAVAYVRGALVGLADVHAANIVHRDLRPGHLFVTTAAHGAPLVKLLDFTSATQRAPDAPVLAPPAGALVGSPAYMAPEQFASPAVDARADLWSIGVILYQALTATLPFVGATIAETCMNVTDAPVPSLRSRRPDAPTALVDVVLRCLAKRADDRFATATELADALATAV